MPGEQRFRLRERPELIGADKALNGDRTQVDDEQVGPALQRLGGFRIECDSEAAGLVGQA